MQQRNNIYRSALDRAVELKFLEPGYKRGSAVVGEREQKARELWEQLQRVQEDHNNNLSQQVEKQLAIAEAAQSRYVGQQQHPLRNEQNRSQPERAHIATKQTAMGYNFICLLVSVLVQ